MTIYKEDIIKIGHTCSREENGCLSIISSAPAYESILLREILKCFGEQYRIISEEDFYWDGIEEADIEYITNLPYELYESISVSEMFKRYNAVTNN